MFYHGSKSFCFVKYQLLLFLFESGKHLQRVLTASISHRKERGNCFQLISELFGELILYKHNIKPENERHLLRDHLGRYVKLVNENKWFRKYVALSNNRLITINLNSDLVPNFRRREQKKCFITLNQFRSHIFFYFVWFLSS